MARFSILGLALCLAFTLGLSAAQAEGFTLPNLNPFAGKKKSASARIGDEGSGPTTIPSANGTLEEELSPRKTPAGPPKPTTWQKFNAGTQAFFAKSKDTLMPWTKKKPAAPTHATGTTKVYPGSSLGGKPAEKKSMFGSWWGSAEKPREAETVDEFIGQPRVPF